jgi:16S rRNA (guanine527-N7)-methyltransferase
MNEAPAVTKILLNKLNFTEDSLTKLKIFHKALLERNKKYNLIGKSTESIIWTRHILDSAQLVRYIKFEDNYSVADLGSGGGFPGLIIAIYNKNPLFHVKLFEKSPVKVAFLQEMIKILDVKAQIKSGSYKEHSIDSNYIVCRAFKKLGEIMKISREKALKSHKLIVLKGKNAQEEINIASKYFKFKYKLEDSITDNDSKIILVDVIKSE